MHKAGSGGFLSECASSLLPRLSTSFRNGGGRANTLWLRVKDVDCSVHIDGSNTQRRNSCSWPSPVGRSSASDLTQTAGLMMHRSGRLYYTWTAAELRLYDALERCRVGWVGDDETKVSGDFCTCHGLDCSLLRCSTLLFHYLLIIGILWRRLLLICLPLLSQTLQRGCSSWHGLDGGHWRQRLLVAITPLVRETAVRERRPWWHWHSVTCSGVTASRLLK